MQIRKNTLYELLVDAEIESLIKDQNLQAVLRKIEEAESPKVYSVFLSRILEQVLASTSEESQKEIYNKLLEILQATDGFQYLNRKKLLSKGPPSLLQGITENSVSIPRPITPFYVSSLLTGKGKDPALFLELKQEMLTADRVDILISFIKFSGIRLLLPAFEKLSEKKIPIRILSTSYTGASDPSALERLKEFPNVKIKVSYDHSRTRMHAKAFHFHRNSGFSTAYIGSANLSEPAMTEGLEWTVKVSSQDLRHIVEKFQAEFETYWEDSEFFPLETAADLMRFAESIKEAKLERRSTYRYLAEIQPRPYQTRILERVSYLRSIGINKNLIVAATGTGKTVIAALEFLNVSRETHNCTLLFLAHRKEILEQARDCFRQILKDENFGDLLVDSENPLRRNSASKHLFCSVQSFQSKKLWELVTKDYYDYVIIDEAHHSSADSYQSIFQSLIPKFILGLTATPERMDGDSILPYFSNRIAAEIRLPEALEEKILCPFHYFGISDSIHLDEELFWKNGKYGIQELENVFTGDDFRAKQRVDLVVKSIQKYQPVIESTFGLGFCVSIKHANYMADAFQNIGIPASSLTGNTSSEERKTILQKFRSGEVKYLFTVDLFNEGIDIPQINTVLFLRPTESLTVFLQQLGRGLRFFPGKENLTVLDFVGRQHKKYRIDLKFSSLLKKNRSSIIKELEEEFPSLPPGCVIQLERVAKENILKKIKETFQNQNLFILESLKTWNESLHGELNFSNFIAETNISPMEILKVESWSGWKLKAGRDTVSQGEAMGAEMEFLLRLLLRTHPQLLRFFQEIGSNPELASNLEDRFLVLLYFLIWGEGTNRRTFESPLQALKPLLQNQNLISDAREIVQYSLDNFETVPKEKVYIEPISKIPLHSFVSSMDIKVLFGLASFSTTGPTGTGVFHIPEKKIYIHLVTFQKEEKQFSPTTFYKDYPISTKQLHWESQSTTGQDSPTGQNHIHFQERGYQIFVFARISKRIERMTAPFLFLGPIRKCLSYSGNRPISFVWELEYEMPSSFFSQAKVF